jgi:predicted transcriptional regulator YheO
MCYNYFMAKNTKSLESTHHKLTKISKSDKAILASLKTVVEGVAEVFGTNCEIVLHSLEDLSHSCIKIEHGHVTGRSVGSPLTDLGIEIVNKADSLDKDVVGSYYSTLDDGRILKSVTILIRNAQGKPIGCMCINIDLSVPFVELIRGFLPPSGKSPFGTMVEHFPLAVDDLVRRTLETVMTDVNKQREISPSEKNKMVVEELYNKGMFNVKGVVDVIAKEMGISRYTVYNYIRDARVRYRE